MFVKNLEAGLTVGILVIYIKYPDFLSHKIPFFFSLLICVLSPLPLENYM